MVGTVTAAVTFTRGGTCWGQVVPEEVVGGSGRRCRCRCGGDSTASRMGRVVGQEVTCPGSRVTMDG